MASAGVGGRSGTELVEGFYRIREYLKSHSIGQLNQIRNKPDMAFICTLGRGSKSFVVPSSQVQVFGLQGRTFRTLKGGEMELVLSEH